jgi:hypothetical protein
MGYPVSGFIEGACRTQAILFTDRLDVFINEENEIRVIDALFDRLDLFSLGFKTTPGEEFQGTRTH